MSDKIGDGIRSFVKQQIHNGKIRDEAVFAGKNLEVRLFLAKPAQDVILTLRMYHIPEVTGTVAYGERQTGPHTISAQAGRQCEFRCLPYFHRNAYLVYEEADDCKIHLPQGLRSAIEDVEQLIPVIFEKGGCPVGRDYGPLVLLEPRSGIVYSDFRYGQGYSAVAMYHRKRERLQTGGGIEMTAVPVGLLLVVLACLQKKALSGRCGQGGKILYRRKIRRIQQDLHYSISPLALSELPLTIPLLEFLMKSSIVSLSSLWGNPAATFAQASVTFSPLE